MEDTVTVHLDVPPVAQSIVCVRRLPSVEKRQQARSATNDEIVNKIETCTVLGGEG